MDNAFPIPGLQDDPDFNGLTKREYFAAMAMQGQVANSKYPDSCTAKAYATWSVELADALLAELAK